MERKKMFPLSCVRAHTGREMSAHKKTWSTHKFSFEKMLHTGNFMCTQTFKN